MGVRTSVKSRTTGGTRGPGHPTLKMKHGVTPFDSMSWSLTVSTPLRPCVVSRQQPYTSGSTPAVTHPNPAAVLVHNTLGIFPPSTLRNGGWGGTHVVLKTEVAQTRGHRHTTVTPEGKHLVLSFLGRIPTTPRYREGYGPSTHPIPPRWVDD